MLRLHRRVWRPHPSSPLPSFPRAGAKTAIKLMQPGVTRSEIFQDRKEKKRGLALKSLLAQIYYAFSCVLCDIISGPCQYRMWSSPGHLSFIGSVRSRPVGGPSVTSPQVVAMKKTKIRRQSQHGNVLKLACYFVI